MIKFLAKEFKMRDLSTKGRSIQPEVKVYCIPGGYSQKNVVGVCGPLPKTLTLFMTKICDFPYPIYDLTLRSLGEGLLLLALSRMRSRR